MLIQQQKITQVQNIVQHLTKQLNNKHEQNKEKKSRVNIVKKYTLTTLIFEIKKIVTNL